MRINEWGLKDPTVLLGRLFSMEIRETVAGQIPGLEAVAELREARTLQPEDLPDMVTFYDPTDSSTVRPVDPANLSNALRSGTYLRSATIEITDDHVTHVIEDYLPWLADLDSGVYLDGETHSSMSNGSLANKLQREDFRRKNT